MNTNFLQPVSFAPSRRAFLRQLALGSALFAVPGAFAEELTRTPRLTEGPFYPDKLPLDTDNDLLIVNNGITPAVGEASWVSGRVLDSRGEPIRNALVEIWQCDHNGVYLHSRNFGGHEKQDKNFQGYGRFLTGSTGEYVFRTIKPMPYTGRTPHIHYKVRRSGKELLTTQLFIKGYPGNERDNVWSNVRDAKARTAITVDFAPLKGSRIGELAARFDLVLGFTPES